MGVLGRRAVVDRQLFFLASSEDAYRISRARLLPGDGSEVVLSVGRDLAAAGAAVEVRVGAEQVRADARPGLVRVDRAAVSPDRVGRAFQPWHVDVELDMNRRWAGYLQPVMTLTLRNLVGADTPLPLRQREDEFVELRLAEVAERPVAQSFDLAHLRALHARLFGDVYPWAGDTRTVDMGRPGSPGFCPWDRIGEEFAYLADHVRRRDGFVGAGREKFVDGVSRVYDAVNRVHAFREGNGRTQRVWLSDLARGGGYGLDWAVVPGAENDRACRLASLGDARELRAVMAAIIRPLGESGARPRPARSAAEVALTGLPSIQESVARAHVAGPPSPGYRPGGPPPTEGRPRSR